jgi:serine phosphatase RsbU (regulator of sigma subunit)
VIETKNGMGFFMTSDGLPSQVGETSRLPFTNRRFHRLLESLRDVPMASKGDDIMAALQKHQGAETRRDDVSLIGFELRL